MPGVWAPGRGGGGGGGLDFEPFGRGYGYNIAAGLADYKAALANHRSQRVKVYCIGDSVTMGEFASSEPDKSWAGVLRSTLQAAYGDAGEGFINSYEVNRPAGANPRWAESGTWQRQINYRQSFGGELRETTVQGSAATVSFAGDSVDVIHTGATAGGTASVTIDGVAKAGISCDSLSNYDPKETNYSGLGEGPHTLAITKNQANGDGVFLDGIFANRGNAGIQVSRIAVPGTEASEWNNGFAKARWARLPPHLAIISFGLNELSAGVGVGTYRSNLEGLVAHFQGLGASVLLLPLYQPESGWTNAADWPQYVGANYDVAQTRGCALVDIYCAWLRSYELAQAWGLFGDFTNEFDGGSGTNPAHPGDRGYADIAGRLAPYLRL